MTDTLERDDVRIRRLAGFTGWLGLLLGRDLREALLERIVAADVDAVIDGTLVHHTWWIDFPSGPGTRGPGHRWGWALRAGFRIATTQTRSASTRPSTGSPPRSTLVHA